MKCITIPVRGLNSDEVTMIALRDLRKLYQDYRHNGFMGQEIFTLCRNCNIVVIFYS